ncbi:MAG: peptidoglycan recognition family protein [Pseudoflavonifractor sp.]
MELEQRILTHSGCYGAGRSIVPKGIMVHAMGVAQPEAEVFLRTWDRPDAAACVHALVTEHGVIQTLPWTCRAWHAGRPPKGGVSANNSHIAFEILEPAGHRYRGGSMLGYDPEKNAGYFRAVYQNAVALCAMLCRDFGFDPLRDILDHSEGHARGIASNHGDVMHWFPKHGKTMDDFRADVARQLEEGEEAMTQQEFDAMLEAALTARRAETEALPVSAWAKSAWDKAVAAGIFDGSKPRAEVTREQAATVLDRLGLVK